MGNVPAVHLPPLERLYQSHGPAVLRRAHQLLGNEAEALEVLHDVFASLLEKPEQFAGRSSIMTYLYGMTTHLALGRLRRERRRQHLLERHHDRDDGAVGARGLVRAELRELLGTLPDELARVAVYHHLDGMTHDEIAELMGCSRQWVTKLLARLRAKTEAVR
jgi:RNA polymerase sigma-70 factor (ECF subfamily)